MSSSARPNGFGSDGEMTAEQARALAAELLNTADLLDPPSA